MLFGLVDVYTLSGLSGTSSSVIESGALNSFSVATGFTTLDTTLQGLTVQRAELYTVALGTAIPSAPGSLQALQAPLAAFTLSSALSTSQLLDLSSSFNTRFHSFFSPAVELGWQSAQYSTGEPLFAALIQSLDPILFVAELLGAIVLLSAITRWAGIQWLAQQGYDSCITLCQTRGISVTEVASVLTFM